MGLRDDITVMILTFNEEANIAHTLEALLWARRILIVDSGSTDRTLEIIACHPQVEVVTRTFDSFAQQCNFGLSRIASPWVLSLDADYGVSDTLAREIDSLQPAEAICGYRAKFKYRIIGKTLRATLYPPRTVLYRRDRARYVDVGHGHKVVVDGTIGDLAAPICHDDRKPLWRWGAAQLNYARAEADHLLAAPRSALDRKDRIRLMAWPAPILVFVYTLLVKRCMFDGWPGWLYALQRLIAETLLAIEIIDRRLRKTEPPSTAVDQVK